MTKLQLLLLEDNPLDADVIHLTLIDGSINSEMLRVSTRTDFVGALQTREFDLILADYALPGFDGISALEIAQAMCPDTPFIFVTASMGEELAIEALKQGATDYVLKQRLGRLVPCVQRALRESEEKRKRQQAEDRLRLVAANLPRGAVFIVDRDLRYVLAEGEAIGQMGMSDRDFVGKTLWEALDPILAARYEPYYRQALAGESFTVEHYNLDRYYISHGIPLRNNRGEVDAALAMSYDITDRAHAEAEREQLLQREQTARSTAENANRIKDEFLAVVSHELRSPLNPILGWANVLQNMKLDAAKTAQALGTIERNAKLQSELIEDLLDVSRILRGKLSLNVSAIHLPSIVREAIETVRLAAEAKSIQIEASLDANIEGVLGDATRLQQIVWNLLSNAVKFTPPGGWVTIKLERETKSQELGWAQIVISDTGKGIEPEFLPHVFEYFRQQDGTTTRKFGGLGLGLAIVHHLVELHGGTVEAASQGQGLGATFTVKLPLMTAKSNMELDSPSPEILLDLSGIQVLVIDDDTDSREFVEFILERAGASVTAIATATEGLLALTQSPPDVLLSDIGMPDMDGYMLMEQIRALAPDRGGGVRAIALTSYVGDFNQQQALQAGFQEHISKPVEPEVLIKAIAKLVK
jgi:signal transduction histidine kinase